MVRKYWTSFIQAMGLFAVIFTILSLLFFDATQVRHFHMAVCIVVPVHLFSFFTFELKLFSRHLWIRRAIVIFFSILIMIAVYFAFGYLRLEFNRYLMAFGVGILIFVVLTVFAYYVGDKIEEQNLKAINQKLADKITKNVE